MKMRTLGAVLLPLLLLTGCWSADPTQEEMLPILSSAMEEETPVKDVPLPDSFSLPYWSGQTLDPITCPDGSQQDLGALLYEGLFELDETFTAQPCLCASSSYDAATLTWTFTLRSGVTFSDGSPLTAADVVATLNRAANSQRYSARFSTIQSVSGEGSPVSIRLNRDNKLLPNLLDIPIVKSGTEKNAVPTGTGPYLWSSGDGGLCLMANKNWWKGNTQPVDRIGLVAIKDQDDLLYQFTSHEVQLITADLTSTSSFSTTGNIVFSDTDTTTMQYIGINVRREPLNNPAVRQALNQGFDREYAISAFLSGHGKAAQFPISPVSSLYPDTLETVYSQESYVQALADAGLGEGHTTLTLLVNEENSFKVSMARYIASTLSTANLSIEVKTLPWEEYTAAIRAGNFDLYYGETRLTADWDLRRLMAAGGSLNYGGFSDATTNALLAEFSSSGTSASAQRLCQQYRQQVPFVTVCFKSTSVLVQENVVDGLAPTLANPFYNLEKWTIHLSDDKESNKHKKYPLRLCRSGHFICLIQLYWRIT